MSGWAEPRKTLHAAMLALRPLPRGERLARASSWTMYYFSALIIPVVASAARTDRMPAVGIDDLLCESDAAGHVVGFKPRQATGVRTGFDALVDDHLAVAVEICGLIAGFPARVAWSNAAVVLDYAIAAARAEGDTGGALHEAEALIGASGDPRLACPYGTGEPRARRVCCLRYLSSAGKLCPGICPKAPFVALS
jgi:ferric iron reductase protein FhuF